MENENIFPHVSKLYGYGPEAPRPGERAGSHVERCHCDLCGARFESKWEAVYLSQCPPPALSKCWCLVLQTGLRNSSEKERDSDFPKV